jgi:hypothetical protein
VIKIFDGQNGKTSRKLIRKAAFSINYRDQAHSARRPGTAAQLVQSSNSPTSSARTVIV